MYGDQFGEFVCGYWDLRVKPKSWKMKQVTPPPPQTHSGFRKILVFTAPGADSSIHSTTWIMMINK